MLRDSFDRLGAELKPDGAILFGDEEGLGLQVGRKLAARLVVRVRNVVAEYDGLSGELAGARHRGSRWGCKSRHLLPALLAHDDFLVNAPARGFEA